MKKGFLAIVCSAAIILLAGCSQNSGTTVQNIDTSNVPDTSMVRPEDYPDNLSGLEKYFAAMNYLPENAEPTTMMYKVIGAIAGDRYTFSVNGSAVTVELYEYNTKKLPKEAKRVISEVKKDGSFYVLESDTEDSAKVSAVLSDDDQFLMIYTDNSSAGANQSRKSEVEAALKSFNGNSGTSQTSKPDETSKQTSQSSDTKESSDNSKVTSDTEESSDHSEQTSDTEESSDHSEETSDTEESSDNSEETSDTEESSDTSEETSDTGESSDNSEENSDTEESDSASDDTDDGEE